MADSKYSMSEATLDNFGFSTFSVASERYGLSGFSGAMAQLGAALNDASLSIRLLAVEQGKLGEVMSSLTAALFAPRSQLKAFSQVPETRDESPFRLNLDLEPLPSLESPRLPMAHQVDNHTCDCELKSPIQVTVKLETVSSDASPSNDGNIDRVLLPSSGAASEKALQTPTPTDRVTAPAQPGEGQNTESSKGLMTGGLAAVVALKLTQKAVDEAYGNVAQKILKRLPFGLSEVLGEDDEGPETPDSGKEGKGRRSVAKRNSKKPRAKTRNNNGVQSQQPTKSEAPRRNPVPAMADTRKPVSPEVLTESPHYSDSPSKLSTFLGKTSKAASFLGRVGAPLMAIEAVSGIAQGVINNDPKIAASSAASLGGAYAGAAIGTMIFPVVGTAIGGFVGGIVGSGLGSILGEGLVDLVDRLGAPEQVSKDLTTTAAPLPPPINFAPSIQVTCPNADNAEQIRNVVAQQLQAQFYGEFVPLMSHNALATRRDAALTDGGV